MHGQNVKKGCLKNIHYRNKDKIVFGTKYAFYNE